MPTLFICVFLTSLVGFLQIRVEFFKYKAASLFFSISVQSELNLKTHIWLVPGIKTFLIMSSSYWHNVDYYSMSNLFLFTYFNLGVWLFSRSLSWAPTLLSIKCYAPTWSCSPANLLIGRVSLSFSLFPWGSTLCPNTLGLR
jgi:hypothetical protein